MYLMAFWLVFSFNAWLATFQCLVSSSYCRLVNMRMTLYYQLWYVGMYKHVQVLPSEAILLRVL